MVYLFETPEVERMTGKNVFILLCTTLAILLVTAGSAAASMFVYSDSFDTDTTSAYNWLYSTCTPTDEWLYSKTMCKDGDRSSYSYVASMDAVRIITGDDYWWPQDAQYRGRMTVEKQLDVSLVEGHFEYRFKPTQIYLWNGATKIKMYSSSDPTDYYLLSIHRAPPEHYPTRLIKSVDGVLVIDEMLRPTPAEYTYSLWEWHTLAIDFTPTSLTGYLDGETVLSAADSDSNAISVDTIHIQFYQHDMYMDDIYVEGIPPDTDGDGVLDNEDMCAGTEEGVVVDEHGCSVDQIIAMKCPADGDYKNHGEYVTCVANAAIEVFVAGLITKDERAANISKAAKSDVGKDAKDEFFKSLKS